MANSKMTFKRFSKIMELCAWIDMKIDVVTRKHSWGGTYEQKVLRDPTGVIIAEIDTGGSSGGRFVLRPVPGSVTTLNSAKRAASNWSYLAELLDDAEMRGLLK